MRLRHKKGGRRRACWALANKNLTSRLFTAALVTARFDAMWHCASTNRAFPPLLVLSLSISGALKTHRRCPSARLNDALTGTVYLFVPSAGSKQALPPRTKHLASSRKRLYCLAHFGISFFARPVRCFVARAAKDCVPLFFT